MINIAVIGGGLAGTACAYILKKYGLNPVIYEAGPKPAHKASGNTLGLYNPRLSAHRTPESEYYTTAFAMALRTFKALPDIDRASCGALHLITDEKKARRFPQTVQNWNWPENELRLLSAAEASDIAGITLDYDALYIKSAGVVSPQKLCHAYADSIEIHLQTPITSLADLNADVVILACGAGILSFPETSNLPLNTIRGQITQMRTDSYLNTLKTALCYGGYCTPVLNGTQTVGATFQRWLDHDQIIAQDDEDNIEKLKSVLPPDIGIGSPTILNHRAGVRLAAKDHFPVIGRVPGYKNLYISAAHGSHGILSSLMAAHLLADLILDQPMCLPAPVIERLNPKRFFK